jgi:hypothetical protein
MAREPVSLTEPLAPFSEGTPLDDLQVENIENDEVLIGDPSLDFEFDEDNEFGANLAELLPSRELSRKAADLVSNYTSDREARSEWEERYKNGLETLEPDGGLDESEDERATRRVRRTSSQSS